MIAKIHSAIPSGYSGNLVEVECDMNRGLPSFNIVGMANKTINEAKERVRSAIVNSKFTFPDKKVTINLAPAEIAKDGTYLDLPIALAVLVLSKQLLPSDIENKLFVGELSLNGEIRPIRGIINIVEIAKAHGITEIFLPQENEAQATLISGVTIFGVKSLSELFFHLKKQHFIEKTASVVKNTKTDKNDFILDNIRGQDLAKRAITIAIAGRHNILLSGPPGAGKTMLARTAANLLPCPSTAEQIAITKIHSLCGSLNEAISSRPFRSPHHTASPISIIGGGPHAVPGEISLAHCGVLFLDELPEYPRSVLEALRQPLEDRTISISRANIKTTYPADFMLIATMNPCPCGYAGDPTHECTCTTAQIEKYHKKLSGPLYDRIDMHINVEKVSNKDLLKPLDNAQNEHNVVKNKIAKAIEIQRKRYNCSNLYNSSLSSRQVSELIHLDSPAEQLLSQASERLNLSARAYFKVVKVARTIADLADSEVVKVEHISESLSFREHI